MTPSSVELVTFREMDNFTVARFSDQKNNERELKFVAELKLRPC